MFVIFIIKRDVIICRETKGVGRRQGGDEGSGGGSEGIGGGGGGVGTEGRDKRRLGGEREGGMEIRFQPTYHEEFIDVSFNLFWTYLHNYIKVVYLRKWRRGGEEEEKRRRRGGEEEEKRKEKNKKRIREEQKNKRTEE